MQDVAGVKAVAIVLMASLIASPVFAEGETGTAPENAPTPAASDEASTVPLRTDAGRSLAAPRIAAMQEFSRRLREEYREFAP